MKTTREKTQNSRRKFLIKKFHTLAGKMRWSDEEYRVFLMGNYGRQSCLDLTDIELQEGCAALERELYPQIKEMDVWRKRLIASIAGWLKEMEIYRDEDSDTGRNVPLIVKVKAIACRASQKGKFNDIPLEQLRSLYSAFTKKQKDLKMASEMTSEMIEEMMKI
jgi:hypothetical protein